VRNSRPRVAITCGISSVGAQRAHQFEFGAFGTFTALRQGVHLDNQVGGGGRLGYFFSNVLSAELDAGYQSPNPKTGTASPPWPTASASLVLNFGTARNLFYILGGYSRSTSRTRHRTASPTTPSTARIAIGSSWATVPPSASKCAASTHRTRALRVATGRATSSARSVCPCSPAAARAGCGPRRRARPAGCLPRHAGRRHSRCARLPH